MQSKQISILEDIFRTITESENPVHTLDQLVRTIAQRLEIDVCSVYVYNPLENRLSLRATVGLSPESVGEIEMDINEGLTGLAIEKMEPVYVIDPKTHPRFKFYARSGEENYRTFLALPLIYHQKVLGVLVLQSVSDDRIKISDIPFFTSIASQVSATVAYTGLLENSKPEPPGHLNVRVGTGIHLNHLTGDPVSERVAEGHARYLSENIDFDNVQCTRAENAEYEKMRIQAAFSGAASQIRSVLARNLGINDQERAIIDAHLMFLEDPGLKRKIIASIELGSCAEYALKLTVLEYARMFRSMEDSYLSERAGDVLDIGRRVLGHLVGISEDPEHAFKRPTIIVASDISPVDLLALRQPNLKGIALARGGRTSHTVILAKSLEIPIVIGVEDLLFRVRENDYLILDGASGFVFVNPGPDILEEYARRQEEDEKAYRKLAGLRDMPAVTLDGIGIRIGGNIGLLSDMALVHKYGADHIGLYRTEFPFLLRRSFPTEEEQVSLYTRMLEGAGGQSVTIRTFDAGGDKFLSYIDYPKEQNPFLGWRSIRISLELEEEFRTQIRAILRASAIGNVNILFPMISGVEEIRKVIDLVESEKENLEKQEIPFDRHIDLGIMLEVPAAVSILDRLLKYIDFVSIGTNDLIQYLLAVDRNNKKVAALYNSLHPSVIAAIEQIIRVCKEHRKPVSICGEAAARPENLLLYVAMGADRISMTPSSIPVAKQFIRSIRFSDAAKVLDSVRQMEDATAIAAYLTEFRKDRKLS